MRVGLINFNRRGVSEPDVPPVPPIGLEYLVEDLEEDGHEVSLLDLCFVDAIDRRDAIQQYAADKDFIGITLRNFGVDNYWMKDDQFFVPQLKSVIEEVRGATASPIVLGGQGFSIYPEATLQFVGADFGIRGPGEMAFRKLLQTYKDHPRGSVFSAPANLSIQHRRKLINYSKYIGNGGFPAIQTKSGCPLSCSYCIEARKPQQLRSLDSVMAELRTLLSYGSGFVFVAEAEFNNHLRHAEAFCDRIIEERLDFTWSTYINPIPLRESLVRKMKEAGCTQPCVSVTTGDSALLKAYDTHFSDRHIRQLAEWFHKYELPFTVDLLFGGPGEDLRSAERTVALMEEIKPSLVGMNFGLRVYGNTTLGRQVMSRSVPTEGKLYGATENNPSLYYPVFYISDMSVKGYLEDVCDSNSNYSLLGYKDFGGVNITSLASGPLAATAA